jgi:hypothetical protein
MGSYHSTEVLLPDIFSKQNIGIAAVTPAYKLYEILHSVKVKINRNGAAEYAEYPD